MFSDTEKIKQTLTDATSQQLAGSVMAKTWIQRKVVRVDKYSRK